MLELLRIKNIAIIDSAEIHFRKGLNIISGETGAGKSIVIEVISLLLGSRASSELIRSGCQEAVIEGLFRIGQIKWLQERLCLLGFSTSSFENNEDVDELLIKRIVHRGGKHRIFVNGELATLSILQNLCKGLIDLCGQHEHQSLTNAPLQIELLDRYGGLTLNAQQAAKSLQKVKALRKEKDSLQNSESERERKADFLKFQMNEIESAQLLPNEDEDLQREKILLQSSQTRIQIAQSAQDLLESEEGCQNQLKVISQKLKSLLALDCNLQPIYDNVKRSMAEIEEVNLGLSRYLNTIELDPDRYEKVQERLSLIVSLRRKYGAGITQILEALEDLRKDYSMLEEGSQRLNELDQQIQNELKVFEKSALKLIKARKKSAKTLSQLVTQELHDLKMENAQFNVQFPKTLDQLETDYQNISFVVRTNAGEPARAIGKIASGGELSRLMLAIRRVIADQGGIGVYLFDEIDSGVGGQTAFIVGRKLRCVAEYNQVICITHLPQVAAFADNHIVVSKSALEGRTLTKVTDLTPRERPEEIARMLGGPKLTSKNLENALELMDLARTSH